jgi:hypothetical protein
VSGTAVRRYGGTAVRRYGGTAVRRYGGTAVRRYGGTALNGSSLASNLLRAAEHPRSGGARQIKSPAREGRVGVKPKDERAKVKSPAR